MYIVDKKYGDGMIIYNAGKIKTYENLKALAVAVGEDEKYADEIWKDMLFDEELIDEFNYFVVNHTIKGEARCGSLTLLDIYFSQMNKYNVFHDLGKNPAECNKERMVLHAFKQIVEMRKDPDYQLKFEKLERRGNDYL